MPKRFTAACVQVTAGTEIAPNLEAAATLVRRARDAGADFIAMPENVCMMAQGRERVLARARTESEHPALPAFCELARETGAWLLVGSLGIVPGDGELPDGELPDGELPDGELPDGELAERRLANRCFLIAADGTIAGRYDKIHMFDVDLPDGESYRESATFRPGEQAIVAPTPWGGLGMTICYDLRFAALFRALAQAGAGIITVPAAFAVPTGRAHWQVLLRARAIETGCFIIAPAQCGSHDGGRRTYGHSLIVDPWGEIMAEAGKEPGVITADIDMARVAECRGMVPALNHSRRFSLPEQTA
ncbi:MAG: carbon-nitrogen hydrolase family protein [Rhodospirillaceae bacterium]